MIGSQPALSIPALAWTEAGNRGYIATMQPNHFQMSIALTEVGSLSASFARVRLEDWQTAKHVGPLLAS